MSSKGSGKKSLERQISVDLKGHNVLGTSIYSFGAGHLVTFAYLFEKYDPVSPCRAVLSTTFWIGRPEPLFLGLGR